MDTGTSANISMHYTEQGLTFLSKTKHFSCAQRAIFFFTLILSGLFLPAALHAANPDIDGKIVRSIRIEIGDIFYKDPVPSAYQFVNNIKPKTDPEIIQRELLFEEGSEITSFLVAESLRILWDLPYIRQIAIDTVVDGQYVDVVVRAHETWTLIPQFSFSSGDGRDRLAAGIADSNVLGQGNRFELLYREDDGTESFEAVWDDRRLLGSKYDLAVAVFDRDDGNRFFTRFEDPIRSLVDTEAWSSQLDTLDGIGRLYAAGDEDFVYRVDSIDTDFSVTFARGTAPMPVHRFSVGYRYQEHTFDEATLIDIDTIGLEPEDLNQDPARVPGNRRFSGPLLAYSFIEPDFIAMSHIDRFQRIQNFNLGDQFGVLVNFAPEALGSYDDTLLYSMNRSRGHQFSEGSFLRGELSASGRATESGFDNSLLEAELLFFNVLGPAHYGDWFLGQHTLAASLNIDYGNKFDGDRQLSLGADSGLRGYDARTFNGDKRFLLNLEDRIHLADDVFELLDIGTSFFMDIGGATYDSATRLLQDELYSNVGVGLVLGFPRSSGGRVLRFDIALPLRDGPDETARFELRLFVSGGQTFDGTLQSEDRSANRPSVAVGF